MALSQYLKKFRHLRKILIVGSGAVGKTSLLKVLKNGKTLSELSKSELQYHRTPFMELDTVDASGLIQSDVKGIFQIYDVAGQIDQPIHPLRELSRTVLGNVDLILLVIANDNVQSLLDLAQWIAIMNTHLSDSPTKFILVNNKQDLHGSIDETLLQNLLTNEQRIVKSFRVSCMTGMGIDDLKSWIVNRYFQEY
ncbi:MAG: GTPase domain-containing protein [Candidatus Hodarchaeales archaeon]